MQGFNKYLSNFPIPSANSGKLKAKKQRKQRGKLLLWWQEVVSMPVMRKRKNANHRPIRNSFSHSYVNTEEKVLAQKNTLCLKWKTHNPKIWRAIGMVTMVLYYSGYSTSMHEEEWVALEWDYEKRWGKIRTSTSEKLMKSIITISFH